MWDKITKKSQRVEHPVCLGLSNVLVPSPGTSFNEVAVVIFSSQE